jgi:hypothetical protein
MGGDGSGRKRVSRLLRVHLRGRQHGDGGRSRGQLTGWRGLGLHAECRRTQQGSKLAGTGALGNADQGCSVAVSADGNTAIVGGFGDNANAGAGWIFTRSEGVWSQQGSKLAGTSPIAQQGCSVALSADGDTAILGGPADDSNVGAVWIFARNRGVWTQQGPKLVGTGGVGSAAQGASVSLSSDGNTAIVGGNLDNGGVGAAWIFTRSGGVWTQQGPKLVGTGAIENAGQGLCVSLSADGNTAVVVGPFTGGAWIFMRSGGVWTQQGAKLVGTGEVGNALQGWTVSLSADGKTSIVGGPGDNSSVGAVWIFMRSGGAWTQQGPKLAGTGAVGKAQQGWSVSLSPDGNTAIVGGPFDNSNVGAAWTFARDGGVWNQQGPKLVGTGAVGFSQQSGSVSLSADGNTAVVGGDRDNSNAGAAWFFTRSGGVWTQQGSKGVGSGAVGAARQGSAVALSADGFTAIVGGRSDNSDAGAAWIFVRPRSSQSRR